MRIINKSGKDKERGMGMKRQRRDVNEDDREMWERECERTAEMREARVRNDTREEWEGME